jgi:hypothetical protein
LVGYPVEGYHVSEPRWINFVRQSENPWLADHKIQGSILYSAGSMLCGVIEAAKQLVPEGERFRGVEFRDIIIGRALIVPPGDEGIRTMLHVKQCRSGTRANATFWREFVLYSEHKGESSVEHCSGLFQVQTGNPDLSTEEALELRAWKEKHAELKKGCKKHTEAKVFYEEWRSCGMQWGMRPIAEHEHYPC